MADTTTATRTWANYKNNLVANREKLAQHSGGGGGGGGGKKGGRAAWSQRMDYWSPSERATRIRIIGPALKYYGRWLTRADGTRAFIIGSSQNNQLDVPDLLAYYGAEEDNSDYNAYPQMAVTVVILEDFHEVEKAGKKPDKYGKLKKYKQLERCGGADRFGKSTCTLCNDKSAKVFGERRYWSMAEPAYDELLTMLHALEHRCLSCKRGELQVCSYSCPECKAVLADYYSQELTPPPEFEDVLKNETFECDHCKKMMKAVPAYECMIPNGTADLDKGCDNPKKGPAMEDAFAYDICVVSRPVKDNFKELVITNFTPVRKPGVSPEKLQPLPLHTFLSWMTLAEQAEKLKRPNPFAGDADAEGALAAFFAEAAVDRATEGYKTDDSVDADSTDF